jgi:hypothetical protein
LGQFEKLEKPFLACKERLLGLFAWNLNHAGADRYDHGMELGAGVQFGQDGSNMISGRMQ